MFFKILKAKPKNLAALRFFGRVARSQVHILNCQKQKTCFHSLKYELIRFAFREYYTMFFKHGILWEIHTIRKRIYSPFGRMRIGAGIISVDIIPYRSDMVLSEGCTQFAKEDAFPSVKRELVLV